MRSELRVLVPLIGLGRVGSSGSWSSGLGFPWRLRRLRKTGWRRSSEPETLPGPVYCRGFEASSPFSGGTRVQHLSLMSQQLETNTSLVRRKEGNHNTGPDASHRLSWTGLLHRHLISPIRGRRPRHWNRRSRCPPEVPGPPVIQRKIVETWKSHREGSTRERGGSLWDTVDPPPQTRGSSTHPDFGPISRKTGLVVRGGGSK